MKWNEVLKAGWKLGGRYLWMPALVFAVHVVANNGFHAYQHFPNFDIPMHFLGGFAIAYFFSGVCWGLEREGLITLSQPWIRFVFVFSLTCMAAMFWEFAEWTADSTLGTSFQRGLDDTILDMARGVVGGAVLLMAQEVGRRWPKKPACEIASPVMEGE